ncbi:MAG: gluconate 2-dehydrogenase subunit 3 family protein [Pantoea dispersa]|nr:gluconate 2-dehydrogenase subunit 3 family protein [Pantoea dispersa]MBZ6392778.1 gluconate 2-dehydrogenase subunit 3 family protein [Pantoea dispersa]MDI6634531.1 gluconate 2-dehydrogenase subunit 3 family protein [Pantoea dispersa]UXO69579.1 gluconate 2-dehydrogenase subunit 3 family protein [Pantoea dispersa]
MMKKRAKTLPGVTRRQVLTWSTLGVAAGVTRAADAVSLKGAPGWTPFADNPPEQFQAQGWLFFTDEEARTVEAMVDRIIPADELSVGGKEAGCAVFIDRQLHGFYGTFERLYMQGPFQQGTTEQGDQSPLVPQQRYRQGLAALNRYVQQTSQKNFVDLTPAQQDALLADMEAGKVHFSGFDAQSLFLEVLNNTMEGFFADPIYGGNKDMVSWKMLGFPGARYDYREYVERHNENLGLEPISIAQWKARG